MKAAKDLAVAMIYGKLPLRIVSVGDFNKDTSKSFKFICNIEERVGLHFTALQAPPQDRNMCTDLAIENKNNI